MKIAVVIFTFPRDFELAARAADTALTRWGRTGQPKPAVFFAVASSDAPAARAAGLGARGEIIEHSFDAGGTLRYSGALHGMRAVYRGVFARGFDALLKLDSDTLLLRPECFTNPARDSGVGFVGVRRFAADSFELGGAPKDRPLLNLCNGCAYLFTRDAFAAVDALPPAAIDAAAAQANGHEDLFFSFCATRHDGIYFSQISKNLCVFDLEKQSANEDTVLIHEPLDAADAAGGGETEGGVA